MKETSRGLRQTEQDLRLVMEDLSEVAAKQRRNQSWHKIEVRTIQAGLLRWYSRSESACQCGDTGSTWSGTNPQATEQLKSLRHNFRSLCASSLCSAEKLPQ